MARPVSAAATTVVIASAGVVGSSGASASRTRVSWNRACIVGTRDISVGGFLSWTKSIVRRSRPLAGRRPSRSLLSCLDANHLSPVGSQSRRLGTTTTTLRLYHFAGRLFLILIN